MTWYYIPDAWLCQQKKEQGKGAEAMKGQDADEQIVELKRDGFEPILVQLMLRADGNVFAFEGDKGARDGVYVCTANQEKKRPEFYEPGMRFKRTGYGDDEYVLVSGSFVGATKCNDAVVVNVTTGGYWASAVEVADFARITPEEFDQITNFATDEFELIEKEPKP
jgi:hypothetical protein